MLSYLEVLTKNLIPFQSFKWPEYFPSMCRPHSFFITYTHSHNPLTIRCVLQVQIQNPHGSLKSIVVLLNLITQAMFSMQLVFKMFNLEFSLLQKLNCSYIWKMIVRCLKYSRVIPQKAYETVLGQVSDFFVNGLKAMDDGRLKNYCGSTLKYGLKKMWIASQSPI